MKRALPSNRQLHPHNARRVSAYNIIEVEWVAVREEIDEGPVCQTTLGEMRNTSRVRPVMPVHFRYRWQKNRRVVGAPRGYRLAHPEGTGRYIDVTVKNG